MLAPQIPNQELLTLDALIAPLSVEQFLAEYWRKQILYRRGADELLAQFKSMLGGFEVPELVKLGTSISAMSYVGAVTDRKDHVSPQQALDLYARGYTLYFSLHNTVRATQTLIANVLRGLGLTPVNAYCSIFASKTSGGLRPHYDNNENFTVQLAGEKTWRFWPNTQVAFPIHPYRHGEKNGASESGIYLDAGLQRTELGPSHDVEMIPGAVLYHPPGSWHATKAGAESISLNVCMQPASYFDLLMGAAAARLMADADVRRYLPAARGDENGDQFRAQMQTAVAGAQASLGELRAQDAIDIAAVPRGFSADLVTAAAQSDVGANTKLRRNALAAFDMEYQAHGAVLWVHLFLGRLTNRVSLNIPAGLEAACVKVADQRAPFTPAALADANISADDVLQVCRALAAVKALRPAD